MRIVLRVGKDDVKPFIVGRLDLNLTAFGAASFFCTFQADVIFFWARNLYEPNQLREAWYRQYTLVLQ